MRRKARRTVTKRVKERARGKVRGKKKLRWTETELRTGNWMKFQSQIARVLMILSWRRNKMLSTKMLETKSVRKKTMEMTTWIS